MNKWFKNFVLFLAVIVVSVGATFATFEFLKNKDSYKNPNSANVFGQEHLKLVANNAGDDSYPDFTNVVDNTVHSVVHIKSISKATPRNQRGQRHINPWSFFFGMPDDGSYGYQEEDPSKGRVMGAGSGVIISEDGYIITNNHVVEKASEVEVTLNDNSKYNAKIVGTDPMTDIALLKIDGDQKFSYVPFGDSDKLKVGEWVLAVGNPFNLTSTVTKGIVSAKARGNIGGGGGSIQSFIQTDAAINPGNSGGALVNLNGQLVGINTAIYSQTGSFAGYGFAVPISIAGKIAADLKEYGAVQRALLGVQIMDLATMREIDELKSKVENIKLNEGVYVDSFAEHSPAKKAGIESGDVIVAIEQVKTPTASVLQEQVSKLRPGDKINVEVNRNNKPMNFEVTLTNSAGTVEIVKKEDPVSAAGVTFKELTNEKKKSLGISYGVEVASVERGGAFADRGISKGYIILEFDRMPVQNVDEAKNILESKNTKNNENDNVLLVKYITSSGKVGFDAIVLE